MKTSRFLLLAMGPLLSLCSPSVFAATWYVDASVSEPGSGTSWESALGSIQAAIDKARDGDVVIVAPGKYIENVDLGGTRITLTSTDPQDELVVTTTVIQGDASGSVVSLTTGEIRGFTITGGKAQGGGGILCQGPAVIASNVIRGNRADGRGGGLLCSESSALVTGNKIFGNRGKEGGGISCFRSADTITHNEITDNEASYGAALHCFYASAEVSSNTIKENTAREWGGAICCEWSSGTLISNNLIFRNSACAGATIRCLDENENPGPIIRSNTIAYNQGEGISADKCIPLIRDCVLWENGVNLDGCTATYCCVNTGDPGEGNLGYDPRFADASEDDFRLNCWSPCIDAGHPDSDFSMEPKPNGGRVNIGAFGNTAAAAVKCPDIDQDGLPDDWEMKWFGTLQETGESDPDQDAMPNETEYLYGWDPTEPALSIVENRTHGLVYQTIQAAICESENGDVLVVHPGKHEEHFGFAGKAVVLQSLDPTDSDIVAQTVVDGMGACSVAIFSSRETRDSVITGLTITGGRGVQGGAVYCSGSSPTIAGNVISDNSALSSGAAIYCSRGSSPLIDKNTISGNVRAGPAFDPEAIHCHSSSPTISNNLITANEGSGIRCEYGASIIVGNTITHHRSDHGGGIVCYYSSPEIRGNTISDNEATYRLGSQAHGGQGGAIFCERSTPVIAENTIRNNRSDSQGATICCIHSYPSILKNTIVENIAEGGNPTVYCGGFCRGEIANNVIARNFAGGITCSGHTSPDIVNNTIVYNCLSGRGYGLYLRLTQLQPIVANNIVWGNGHDVWGGELRYCCVQSGCMGTNNTAWAPCFVDPENGDYHLLPWSPCIDAGDPASDFANEPQPNGGRVNIGAYGNTPEATVSSADTDNDGLPDAWEQSWFGDLSQEGEGDADNDGIWNVTEYLFNSNPVEAPSLNRVQNLRSLVVYPTMSAAISEAEDGDELVAYPATYRENISFSGKAITVRSLVPEDPWLVAVTIIEAAVPQSVVRFTDGEGPDSVLAGLTITGGDAEVGGGVYCYDASPTIRNNVICGNKADRGGGVCFRGNSSAVLIENEVKDNAAREGGGIQAIGESSIIQGNRICGNHAVEDGGGIYCDDFFAVISGNFIRGNSAERNGGGIYGESENIRNNVIVGNTAGGEGGAVCATGRGTKLVNNTIVGNRASSVGGVTTYYYDCDASLLNCILWDNEDDLHHCHFSYCCVQNLRGIYGGGPGNFSLFPHFVHVENDDYHLASWSPCIDAGDPQSDFSGEPEPNGGRINVGAYGNTLEATSKSFDRDGDELPDDWELHHFGDLSQTAFADPDTDGIFNMDEYLCGWNPTLAERVGVHNLTSGRAYPRIQDAIDEAEDGDELLAYPGRYRERIDFLGKNVTLMSTDPEDPATVASTVIDAEERGTVVSFVNGEGREAIICGFTVTGGGGEDRGGIYCEDSSPTISRNVVTGNKPCEYYGGGITCSGGSPFISFNTITKNRSCGQSGGVDCGGSCPHIVNNLIEDNDGGGISCWGGSPIIRGNVIRLNQAWGSGGGIRCDDSSALIENNVIADNRAGYNGGGIRCGGEPSPRIINNTIAGNVAIRGGAGISAEDDSPAVIENCIIWNRGTELVGCSASYSCVRGGAAGQGNLSLYPHFVDPANGDYHLATWSPCIDAGNRSSPFGNEPRPNGSRINMGAYGNTPEAACRSLDVDSDGLPDTWEWTYFGGPEEIPEGDADGDLIRNGAEYRFGWDPVTPAAGRVVNRASDTWYEEIQVALYEAKEGAEIIVLPGTYHENLILPGFTLSLSSVDSSDPAMVALTVINGDGFGRVITVAGGTDDEIRISGLTITGGKANYGGGIYCENSSLTIENNVIDGNAAGAGGGICCLDSSPRIVGNTITSNECAGGSGGGIFCRDSLAFISGNSLSHNSCMYSGGAIMLVSGSAMIQGNSMTDNQTDDGGGICCCSCSVVISANHIHYNVGHDDGGAVCLDEATATIAGNSICNNRGYYGGGGIYSGDSSVIVVNTTIADNWSNYVGGVRSENSSVTIVNCILWGNTDDLDGCSATYSCIENVGGENEGEGNIHAQPLFVDTVHDDYHLRAGSPCIEAGTNEAPEVPSADTDGEYRPFGLRVDMGADEFVDQDQDLLPDYWEIANFGNLWTGPDDDPDEDSLANSVELTHSTNPHSSDTDSDGSPDAAEVVAGTDPLDPASVFRVTRIELEDAAVHIRWSSVPGRSYQVYASHDLRTWEALGEAVVADDIYLEAHLLDQQLAPFRFYRVEVIE